MELLFKIRVINSQRLKFGLKNYRYSQNIFYRTMEIFNLPHESRRTFTKNITNSSNRCYFQKNGHMTYHVIY